MPEAVPEGTTKIYGNGYKYIKHNGRWLLYHHYVAEVERGYPIDTSQERVVFVDGDNMNFDPANILVKRKKANKEDRIRYLRDKIQGLQEELADLLSSS